MTRPKADHNGMEHRWGRRFPLLLPVHLQWSGASRTRAQMLDLSVSGALIRTDLAPQLLSRIEVLAEGRVLPAMIVRRTATAIGVEWLDIGSEQVQALMAPLQKLSYSGVKPPPLQRELPIGVDAPEPRSLDSPRG